MTPQQLTARLNEAIAHHNAGRWDRAEAIYRQALPFAQRAPVVLYLSGLLAEQRGEFQAAAAHYAHSLRVDPTAAKSAVRLASLLIAESRASEAETLLRRALEASPKSHEAWNALAFSLKIQGRLADAALAHERAVQVAPRYVEGWCHWGLTLGTLGFNHRALRCYDQALALDPSYSLARFGRGQALHKTYRTEEAVAEYDAFLRAQPQHVEARSFRLFALQSLERLSREQLWAEHRAYGQAVGAASATFPDHDLNPDRKLRVAILSPDFRTHSCAYFIEPLLRHLDAEAFELYLYHDHFVEDAVTARFRGLAARWRNFVGQPHGHVEALIRADQPDILIDLSGHVAGTVRLPLFAKRLAPVQITYLGYPDTTGVPAMDFRFTDETADPAGDADRYASEKLVRFAPTAWAYQAPEDAPDVAPLPSPAAGTITFGCFNSPTKFTDAQFAVWATLLQRVANARLLLKGRDFTEPAVRDHLLARMQAQGIARDRVELLPRTATIAEHLAHYGRVDIALDTYPYNGTTTTCEALWMGRPVVTRTGERHASRVGLSLLRAIGRPEWAAATSEAYVDLAVRLASDRPALASASASLRSALRQSVLLDQRGQSGRFAAALRACWRERAAAMAAARSHPADSAARAPAATLA